MEIITIASAKGGVSKSLLAINLFDYLKRKGEDTKVLLVDTDKQKSAFEFLEELKEEDISAVSTEADFDFVLTQ
ncbi:AAA family ATPase, partial [Glaesserella parasuis]|nr:AAA family ATPase [Glaesserella parasuis]